MKEMDSGAQADGSVRSQHIVNCGAAALIAVSMPLIVEIAYGAAARLAASKVYMTLTRVDML